MIPLYLFMGTFILACKATDNPTPADIPSMMEADLEKIGPDSEERDVIHSSLPFDLENVVMNASAYDQSNQLTIKIQLMDKKSNDAYTLKPDESLQWELKTEEEIETLVEDTSFTLAFNGSLEETLSQAQELAVSVTFSKGRNNFTKESYSLKQIISSIRAGVSEFSITFPEMNQLLANEAPQIKWSGDEFLTDISYHLTVHREAGCQNPIQSHFVMEGTEHRLNALENGHYFVCIVAKDSLDNSETAEEIPFQVDSIPPLPNQLSTPGTTEDPSPKISWTPAQDDTEVSYNLYITSDAECSTVVQKLHDVKDNFANLDSLQDGTYYACLELVDQAGNTTDVDPISFTINTSVCGGVTIGGSCWYLGSSGASCTTTCTNHGGVNSATSSYINGSQARCGEVLDALGGANDSTVSTGFSGFGCYQKGGSYYLGRSTSYGANYFGKERACACNQ